MIRLKRGKKGVISLLVVFALFCCCTFNSFAAEIDLQDQDYARMSTEELAYCNLEEAADIATRQAILDARREIIYSTSWTVDGQLALRNADGTIETLPEFSDLFPDWELPTEMPSGSTGDDSVTYFSSLIYLETATTTNAEPFARIVPLFNTNLCIRALAIPGSSWNCGAVDVTTGQDKGFITGLPVDKEAVMLNTVAGHQYAIRASSNGAAGYAAMEVYQEIPIYV